MACAYAQKILYDCYMLSEEAKYWCDNVRHKFEVNGVVITWVVFKGAFLEKYFPTYVRSKKKVEFLELQQGNMTVVDYAAKFEAGSSLTIMGWRLKCLCVSNLRMGFEY